MRVGKSMYVWNFWLMGSPAQLAERAVQIGLNSIMLKIADGSAVFGSINTTEAQREQALVDMVTAFRQRKIEVIGWQYVYGDNPSGEADTAVRLCNKLKLDGFIIDAEGEYKRPNMASKAALYMQKLSDGLHIPIGLSTYRYPKYHRELPWKEFLAHSDFVVPQVYWELASNSGQQLIECVRQYNALYAEFSMPSLPMYPAGCAYSSGTWKPTSSQIVEFSTTAKAQGLSGISFWWWKTAVDLGLEATISGLKWGTDYEDVIRDIEHVKSEMAGIKVTLDSITGQLKEFKSRIETWINGY